MKKLILMIALLSAGFFAEKAFEKKQLEGSNTPQTQEVITDRTSKIDL